ncbi:MAG: hypothetical protein IM613_12470 [Cytophagales bacterium]|nr:hypothetical protein [Cytophagales bacterium]
MTQIFVEKPHHILTEDNFKDGLFVTGLDNFYITTVDRTTKKIYLVCLRTGELEEFNNNFYMDLTILPAGTKLQIEVEL